MPELQTNPSVNMRSVVLVCWKYVTWNNRKSRCSLQLSLFLPISLYNQLNEYFLCLLATVSLFSVMHCSLGQLFKHSTLVKFVIAPAKSLKHCFVLSLIVVLCSISIQSAPLKLWNHLEKPHRHCLNYHHSLFILSAQSG